MNVAVPGGLRDGDGAAGCLDADRADDIGRSRIGDGSLGSEIVDEYGLHAGVANAAGVVVIDRDGLARKHAAACHVQAARDAGAGIDVHGRVGTGLRNELPAGGGMGGIAKHIAGVFALAGGLGVRGAGHRHQRHRAQQRAAPHAQPAAHPHHDLAPNPAVSVVFAQRPRRVFSMRARQQFRTKYRRVARPRGGSAISPIPTIQISQKTLR